MMQQVDDLLARSHALVNLIQDPDKMHVGFVVRMSYNTVTVLTNDEWKWRVDGIPQNSFLVATAFNPAKFLEAPSTERIVILLRVVGPATLPQDGETYKAVIEHYQRKGEIQPDGQHDGLEKITHARLQFAGLECHILGTFYSDARGKLLLGSDVEDFYSVARLRVYKPTVDALQRIVNYLDPRREEKAKKDAQRLLGDMPAPIHIGHVRYTSANPLQIAAKTTQVPIYIQPLDFLARRTAVFGMTRTGKSNTVKTTVSAVTIAARKAEVKVGQVIFDMNGEYANANGQDQSSSLADALGTEDVIRYRGLLKDGFVDFRDNFYRSFSSGLGVLAEVLTSEGTLKGQDIQTLIHLDLTEPTPNDYETTGEYNGAKTRYEKKVALYKCILHKSQFPTGRGDNEAKFSVGKDVLEQLHDHRFNQCGECGNKNARVEHVKRELGDPLAGLDLEKATNLLLALRAANKDRILTGSSGSPWFDETEKGLANVLAGEADNGMPIRSSRPIKNGVLPYHSATGSDNVPRDIYKHLSNGKIVIVDLSVGSEAVKKAKSDTIARYILNQSMTRFTNDEAGLRLPIIMVYVEEAHNLIGKDAELDQTWPKLAKEGAKFNIGMVYSTQEPSSMHPNILSNTENFFVTHLNNDNEINTISKYYDFKDFSESIKRAQDVGFARIKTLSSSFVVPTQILQFEPSKVKRQYESLLANGHTDNVIPREEVELA